MATIDFHHWNGDILWLVLALALAAGQKVWRAYRDRRTETWPISYGNIGKVSVDSTSKPVKVKAYYIYRVGAESFSGSFAKTFDDPDEANAWADALDKKQVAVRYNPGNVSSSQLREVDLEPIVRAATPFRPTISDDAELPGWQRALLSLGLVVAACGLALTVTMLIGDILDKPLVPPKIASLTGLGGFVAFVGSWFLWHGWGKQRAAKPPGWMKYIEYVLVYYAIFVAFLPSHGTHPSSHRGSYDVRYQLLLYFSAFEWCYTRLQSRPADLQHAAPVRLS